MPARRPAHARRIELPGAIEAPEPSPEEIARRAERRNNAILSGGPMRLVTEAAIAEGGSIEVDTGTHIVTITVAEK